MFRKLLIICVALLAIGSLRAQQVESRIAGLEGNEEYMSLLRESAQLQIKEDSVVNVVERVRQQLRENPQDRQRFTDDILQLESRIFAIRNAKGRLVDRINSIEQDWVFSNLDNSKLQPAEPTFAVSQVTVADSLKVRNLVDNLYFREHLLPQDYAALQRAQALERQAEDYATRYSANHAEIVMLAEQYAAVTTEAEALEIYGKYTTLRGLNRVLADSLAGAWNYIFDNKSYAYSYLLDELNEDTILAREEEQLAGAARQLSTLRDEVASETMTDYYLRKRVMLDFEMTVAEVLELAVAHDSLQQVAVRFGDVDIRLPKVDVHERYFLDYDSLKFSATPRYSAQNPIPECRIYTRGTIYRILLGTFATKRSVSTFRGVEPLCYQVGDDGRWSYFAGGFATREEAVHAQKQAKSRGFVRPEIVVWNNGVFHNLSRDPEALTVVYRVEIMSEAALSDAVKAAIVQTADGRELARVGHQMFTIGPFDDRALADRVAEVVQQTDGALQIKVAEVTE